jgi:hypothetical protein
MKWNIFTYIGVWFSRLKAFFKSKNKDVEIKTKITISIENSPKNIDSEQLNQIFVSKIKEMMLKEMKQGGSIYTFVNKKVK